MSHNTQAISSLSLLPFWDPSFLLQMDDFQTESIIQNIQEIEAVLVIERSV